MSYPGTSRARYEQCRGCGDCYDPEWLVDELCPECREMAWRRNVLAERG